jgi:exonuclease SbcD
MLVLHTSDWHLGRSLHGHDLTTAQGAFVDHLVDVVRSERVDLVVVSGDVHDRAIPPVAALRLLDDALSRLRDAGASVVVISGNHDAAARLGDKAGLLDPRIRIRTDPATLDRPVELGDRHGPVRIYPIPYLEPAAVEGRLPAGAEDGTADDTADTADTGDPADAPRSRSGFAARTGSAATAGTAAGTGADDRGEPATALFPGMVPLFDDQDFAPSAPPPGPDGVTGPGPSPGALAGDEQTGAATRAASGRRAPLSHAATMRRAMSAVGADLAAHGGARSIVVAHAWVTGAEASESERDISVGGVSAVPASLFDGITYTALGHLHRPQRVRSDLRYSGSPLAYSFSEAGDVKSSLLVEITAAGLGRVERVDVPVHRRLTVLRGPLEQLLTRLEYGEHTGDLVAAVLTDALRPLDAMASLQRRFPYTLTLSHQPDLTSAPDTRTFAERTRGRGDLDVATDFVGFARGEPASDPERALLAAALTDVRRAESEEAA